MNLRKLLCVVGMWVALGAASAYAQTKVMVDVTGLSNGAYVLVINGNTATLNPVTVLNSTPAPGPQPTPNTLTDRAKVIRDAAVKINDEDTAKDLAVLYREIGKQIGTGQIPLQTAPAAVKMATDLLLPGDKGKAWQPVREIVSSEWDTVSRAGGKAQEFSALLKEAADGLDAAAPSRAIDPARLQMIFEIIKIVLQLLAK